MAQEHYVISLSRDEVAVALREYIWGQCPKFTSSVRLREDGAEIRVAMNEPVDGKEIELARCGGFMAPRLALVRRKRR